MALAEGPGSLNEDANNGRTLYLVDGSAYIFRAYHALPPLTRSDGMPVGAVRGFMTMMLRLVEDHARDYFAVIFDASGVTFRNDIYDQYKANRDAPPEDLKPQFGLVRDATRALNLSCIEKNGFEADDIIATYARQGAAAGLDVVIVSSDKDLMQLVDDRICMLDPMKQKRLYHDDVVEKFGVGPARVVDVQSLAGDSVDNVPGVPGIGVKTAALLINEYGDLDALLQRAGEIKQPKRRENLIEFADLARISRDLVRLDEAVPDLPDLEDLRHEAHDAETLRAFLEAMEFKSIAQRLGMEVAAPAGNAGMATDSTGPAPVAGAGGEGAAAAASAGADAEPAIADNTYELVTSVEALEGWIARAEAARLVAFDTETTSLDQQQAELVGVSLCVEPGEACYIPLTHRTADLIAEMPEQIALSEALPRLKALLENPAVMKVAHNAKYDLVVLRHSDIHVAPVDDSMLLSFVLDGGKHNHGLDELSQRMLGHQTIPYKVVAGVGKAQVTFDYVPLDKALDYAAEDADIALRLYRRLKARLVPEKMTTLYQTMERPLIDILVDMERAGIKVDPQILSRMSSEFSQDSARLEDEIYALAGETFNIASPKQMGEILFGKLGLPGGKKTGKTGAYSTGADVLEGLAAQGHALPRSILDWRQVNKLRSTYTDALQHQINPRTWRVHTSYAMTGAQTGRLSSTDPNLQNIPVRTEAGRKIRSAFIAEPGCKLVSIDYSQIELRLTAHMAEEETLRQAFRDGLDIHAMTASQVFGVPIEGMDPMVRRNAKAINFGIIYGISAFGLANNLGISNAEAKDFIDQYFERFPGIRHFMERAKLFGRDNGYVETLFGRKIHLKGIADKNFAQRGFAERQAINAPIQGTAADIIKRAMLRMPAALEAAGLSAKMLLQVHDELIFEAPEAETEALVATAREVMENACAPVVELAVPLVADAGIADNWMEAH
ncbi:MAG: DNA polymerase I [Rhodospirillaceae bacterium]|nr:DNA polymerase I [Rhodospirillaceae bacterium]